MSLLNTNKLISIKLYYQLINKDGYERIKVLKDEDAIVKITENENDKRQFESKALEEAKEGDDPKKFVLNPNKEVHILNTKWKEISWKEQNDILNQCKSTNQLTGLPDIDNLKFRDQRIKSCLKEWDLKDDAGQLIPCHPEIIEQLPFEVIFALVQKFDSLINLDDEEEKKS